MKNGRGTRLGGAGRGAAARGAAIAAGFLGLAGGRRPGDQWAPYIAPGRVNRWVQVGTMRGDPANTCDPDGPAAVGDTIHSDAAWAVEAVFIH